MVAIPSSMMDMDNITDGQFDHLEVFVYAGVELLDARKPGWRPMINVDRIDLLSELDCILAQIYGDFWLGLEVLFPEFDILRRNEPAMLHGFNADSDAETNHLTIIWKELLSA